MAETGNTVAKSTMSSPAQIAIDPLESVMARLSNLEKDLADTKAELAQLKQQKEQNLEKDMADTKAELAHLKQQTGRSVSEVAFTVNLTNHLNNLGSGQTIKFDNVLTNLQSGYDPLTGVFTCPVDGNYVFIVTIMCHANTFNELRLMMNGVSKMLIYTGDKEMHNQGTNSIVLQMEKSDKVWIETGGYPAQSSVYGQGWSSFTGIKLN